MEDIYTYIRGEEATYKALPIPIADGYDWNMYEHVRKSTLYRDSKFSKGANDGTRPFKNIIRRIITLQHVATGFDVKDIEPFVNDSQNYYKSFLTRKYHPKWARKNNLDTFIDEMVESYVDFGLVLVKHVNQVAPEVVALQSLAFCDQTDILSGPICIKHQYSPAQLKKFKWKNIDTVIDLAREEKTNPNGVSTKTPGKFIEVYELDGQFPRAWMNGDDEKITEEDETTYTDQMHIVTFYKDAEGNKKGITLFKGKGDPKKYKALKRDPIFGRACGFGGIEELFEAQTWTNYDEIRIQEMLDTASKIIGVTTDSAFAARNRISDVENGEFLVLGEGKTATQLDTTPRNLVAFENASAKWEQHAQDIGSASDAQLGDNPAAGTPFKLQQLVTQQGKGPHDYRKGKVATFLAEMYRDWLLEDMVKEMNNAQEFTEELSLDELQYVADKLVDNQAHTLIKEKILNGEEIVPEEVDQFKQKVREQFMKGGNKRFFSLLQNELKDLPVDVEINIAGKQKDLSLIADKMSNIIGRIIANPPGFVQMMQLPQAAKAFNTLMEASGLDEINFGFTSKEQMDQMQKMMQPPQPQPALANNQPQ